MILFWICIFYAVSVVGYLAAIAAIVGEITVKAVVVCFIPILNTIGMVSIFVAEFGEYVLWESKK